MSVSLSLHLSVSVSISVSHSVSLPISWVSLCYLVCLSQSVSVYLSVYICLSLYLSVSLCISISVFLYLCVSVSAGVARAEARSCSCREQRASRRTKREDRAARGPDPGLPRPAAQSREARDRASPREWVRGSLAAGSVTQENPYKAEHADESLGKAKAENSSSPQRRARPQASDPGRAESAGSQAEVEPEGAPGPLPGC